MSLKISIFAGLVGGPWPFWKGSDSDLHRKLWAELLITMNVSLSRERAPDPLPPTNGLKLAELEPFSWRHLFHSCFM